MPELIDETDEASGTVGGRHLRLTSGRLHARAVRLEAKRAWGLYDPDQERVGSLPAGTPETEVAKALREVLIAWLKKQLTLLEGEDRA